MDLARGAGQVGMVHVERPCQAAWVVVAAHGRACLAKECETGRGAWRRLGTVAEADPVSWESVREDENMARERASARTKLVGCREWTSRR